MGQAFTFSASGQLTAPTGSTVPINNLTVDGVNVGSVGLDISGGLTQYAAASGTVTTNDLKQNGYASGSLNSVEVGENGIISGKYSNGSVIGRVAEPVFVREIEVALVVRRVGAAGDGGVGAHRITPSGRHIRQPKLLSRKLN